MSKVTLPKEVAEAIEIIKGCGWSNYYIVASTDKPLKDSRPCYEEIEVIRRWAVEGNSDKLLEALVNGYEVEKFPEDKLREYIESNRTWIDRPEDYAISERQRYVGRNQGVMMTLSILGITIEGIND